MNILITGGFGSIGEYVIKECLARGHNVSVFEVHNQRTAKLAKLYSKKNVKVFFGDIRKYDDVKKAVTAQDAIIHMAAILPPASEASPQLCKEVNVNGTANVIKSIQEENSGQILVEISSASVMGFTQNRTPPVKPYDAVSPTDHYSNSKVEVESMVRNSGLKYCILRLAAVMPTYMGIPKMLKMIKVIFDMPLNARCEIVYDIDVAYALAAAVENLSGSSELSGKIGFIGGGRQNNCQIVVKEMLGSVFKSMGLGMPNESLFPSDGNSYYLDWYDTDEIQSILKYQRHSFEQWRSEFIKSYRLLRPFIKLFRKPIIKYIEFLSPQYVTYKGASCCQEL